MSLTQRRDGGAGNMMQNQGEKGGKSDKSNLNLIAEINESLQNVNDVDKSHFFFINGYISRIKNDDKVFYPACMGNNCKRKVIKETEGWRCETDNKIYASYVPTYMFSARISDSTESFWVSFAREHGNAIMGMTAEEFRDFKESSSEETVQEFFDSLMFKQFNIMVKGRVDSYGGEHRMRYFAAKVFPYNVQAENRALEKRLNLYKNLSH
mmetsp:Transcript_6577/g.4733  ORF Transcript_6577/g.4733 Transcript_6577/m.4733 type:complete len:210 (-) Transcript_6577:142-771(-)